MAGAVLKVLLPSRIFDYSALLEDSREVSTVGIISSQLVGKRIKTGEFVVDSRRWRDEVEG